MSRTGLTRRRALGGVAAGASLPLLHACGADETDQASDDPATSPSGSPSSSAPTEESASASPSPSQGEGGLVATDDVPVGGGVVLADQELVVTQPSAGEFLGFSAICTHSGCLVSEVSTTIDCRCHGSAFDLTSGAPVAGPATEPLGEVAVRVRGGQVVAR